MRVTFAYPLTTADGAMYGPDETADLPDDEARQLIRDGMVRIADRDNTDARAPQPTPAAAEKPAARGKTLGGES
jgi:hypothetical protein